MWRRLAYSVDPQDGGEVAGNAVCGGLWKRSGKGGSNIHRNPRNIIFSQKRLTIHTFQYSIADTILIELGVVTLINFRNSPVEVFI